jgi:capsular polysaccharide transport system permease protein
MKALRALWPSSRAWQAALVLSLVFSLYWSALAARRYVSEAHVVVDVVGSTQVSLPSGGGDLASIISGQAPSRDILLLRDYMLSSDMLAKLDAKLDLRGHYASSYDPFSRMLYKSVPFEWFLAHYRSRVSVEYDELGGVLVVQAQAYTPKMAHAIGEALVGEGGRFINELAQKLAREQVLFAEREAGSASQRLAQSRQTLLTYQNSQGLVSPTGTVDAISAVVARLESELSDLQARRHALEAYLAPGASDLVQLREQIKAVQRQLSDQRARLASTAGNGNTLNRVAEEYERLAFDATFHQMLYQTTISTLERARYDATRTLKKISVLQEPTRPEWSTEPGRLYYSTLFALGTLLLAGILQLLVSIIREHRD